MNWNRGTVFDHVRKKKRSAKVKIVQIPMCYFTHQCSSKGECMTVDR